jgi:hypothetical protein
MAAQQLLWDAGKALFWSQRADSAVANTCCPPLQLLRFVAGGHAAMFPVERVQLERIR